MFLGQESSAAARKKAERNKKTLKGMVAANFLSASARGALGLSARAAKSKGYQANVMQSK